jgi:hypothetical protein
MERRRRGFVASKWEVRFGVREGYHCRLTALLQKIETERLMAKR